jgi:hypothetical protein
MKYTAITLGLLAALGYAATQFNSAPAVSMPMASVPTEIQAPTDQQLLLTVSAEGDQIYICQPKADAPALYEWTLKAPEAELLDQSGQVVGTHYGGPSWEMADGSKIVGLLNQKVDAPQTDAIPWLLLQVKSHEGEGMLSQVNWIQRVNTVGGKAPATGCDQAHQNQEVRVGYSADYHFYGE